MRNQVNAEKAATSGWNKLSRLLMYIVLSGTVFGLGFALATGEWLSSFATSYAISTTISVLRAFDHELIQPRLKGLPRDRRLVLEIAFAFVENISGALVAWTVCYLIFGFGFKSPSIWLWITLIGSLFVISLIIQAVGYAWRFYQELKEKEIQEQQLRALATQAELKALKAQINPHFLFNTLNTIAELIHTNPDQAEATVERLAEMFRYVLAGSERGMVRLEEELAFVDGYLEIEQVRFGERLRVTRQIDPAVLRVPVPSLILQPLVENAVWHGRGIDGSIALAIRAQARDAVVEIAIADQGPGMPAGCRLGVGRGMGLSNVDERLRKTYGEEQGLEIAANQPQGTLITVRIPVGGET